MSQINKFFNFNNFLIKLKINKIAFGDVILIYSIDYDWFCSLFKSVKLEQANNHKIIKNIVMNIDNC